MVGGLLNGYAVVHIVSPLLQLRSDGFTENWVECILRRDSASNILGAQILGSLVLKQV